MLILIPAYGRDYKSQADALKDFNADKDFQVVGMGPDAGAYTNKRDLLTQGVGKVAIRYKNQRMKFYADVKAG